MSNKIKSGLLILMLVGPLLLFGLFHLFGTNHYSIKKFYPIAVDAYGDTTFHQIPDFNFINQNNEEVTLNDFDDKIFIVDFMFTTCPTICPKLTNNMAYLQRSFKNHDDEVMFLSPVLPEDLPQKLSTRIAENHALRSTLAEAPSPPFYYPCWSTI